MTDPSDGGQRGLRYEVQLTGRVPDSLRADHPDMTVRTVPAQTALRRRVSRPQELDALLREIGTVGLTVTGVHRAVDTPRGPLPAPRGASPAEKAGPGAGTATYEIRVVGELGRPLLRHLRCTHYSVPQQTLVRLTLTVSELNRFLHACIDAGATLEQVRRVDPAPNAGWALAR
jgi:hypothetical protein